MLAAFATPAAAADYCVTCHAKLEGPLADPVRQFELDTHRRVGLSCADCHGGDPSIPTKEEAKGPGKGYLGRIRKTRNPQLCARCHSDAVYMHRFNPRIRTDQYSDYLTSVHGKRLQTGDTNVAACTDCHGVHSILPARDTRSLVHPARLVETCARCHANPEHMKGYPIPTDQVENYLKSVHAEKVAAGETAAPTCATCHGNHGATPPGVASVAHVCGTCHVFFEDLFNKSPHKPAFDAMGLPGCVQCHSNHAVLKPGEDWVGTGPNSTCIICHGEGDGGYTAAQSMAADLGRLRLALGRAEEMVDRAERSGMEVSAARVELAAAHESLIKAQVMVHSFDPAEVKKLAESGVEVSDQAHQAGVLALKERDFRRKGLGVSLVFIVLAIIGLTLKIRQMESQQNRRP
jgi:hypothetical protein